MHAGQPGVLSSAEEAWLGGGILGFQTTGGAAETLKGMPAEIIYREWCRRGRRCDRWRYLQEDGQWREGIILPIFPTCRRVRNREEA